MLQRVVLAVLLTASCFAQDKKPSADVARMEQIIQASVPKQFMGTVLVAQDGKVPRSCRCLPNRRQCFF